MTAAEYRQAIDALPFGKHLPGGVYLLDPGEDSIIVATVIDHSTGPEHQLPRTHSHQSSP